jgi:thioredoxin-related protein
MSKNKSLFIILTGLLLCQLSFGQVNQVRFDQLDSLQKKERRTVAVFLHTSWCKYCGTMKNTTFQNSEVLQLLNQSFYFVSLDIEEKRDISFFGHTFKYKPTGNKLGVHELAEQLGTINGALAYPGISFLNADYEIIHQQEGFLSPKALLYLLKKLIHK